MKQRYQNNRNLINKTSKNTKYISEANFLANVVKKGKSFIKDKLGYIKKNAKKFFRELKKDFMQPKLKTKFNPGSLIAMNYNAKDATKKYDRTPLIICLGWSQNPKLRNTHFYGLNLHWLKMRDRVLMASFFTELNERKGGVDYNDIKPFLHKFKGSPVLRMYIYKNVSGKVIVMPKDQFMTAAGVPSETWMGGR